MHGRPRKPAKPEDAAAAEAKAEKLRSLQNQVLHNHHNKIYTKEALQTSFKLLEVNPEVYTAWNYRKLAVQSILGSLTDAGEIKSVIDGELRVVEVALRRNPKCYGAWHHRKWVLSRELQPTDFDHEFRLLDQLLKADYRNFHGWNYRRFVAALKNVSEEEELQFMTDKINANFSNYSAWHNRSVLLSQLLKKKGQDSLTREKVLSEEFELVHQALFTDPDDQSGWFYYLWLLDQTTASFGPLLISSWPVNDSNLVFLPNDNTDDCIPSTASQIDYLLDKGTLPLVLYFNQPVKGVDTSTVTVQSLFIKNEDLIWTPLSTAKSAEGHCWVTYLNIPEINNDASTAYPVEVSVGYTQGIISSSDSLYSHQYRFVFTLNVRCTGSEPTKGKSERPLVVWEEDDSSISDTVPSEIDLVAPMRELGIFRDPETVSSKWLIENLSNEISLFRELLSELNCKIAKLTLARLLVSLDAMCNGAVSLQKRIHSKEVLELYDDLIKLDPPHIRYYMDERSLVLMDQVTSDRKSFAKRFSRSQGRFFLRLNSLSLTRIGFAERLLWVQSLDLSNNELRSIEGLEAMQFLKCLNLRNNKISSFTALEPLKLLGSLEVLDISYNEIGSHTIDTTRYLCASPLSHSAAVNPSNKKYGEDVRMLENWEAMFLFQDLHLIQLDMVGNAAATENLLKLLVKVLPTLKWCNGVRA